MIKRRAVLLSCSPIADDPRVRRLGDSLFNAGWSVVGIGLPAVRMSPPHWNVREATAPQPKPSTGVLARADRSVARYISRSIAPAEAKLGGERTRLGSLLAETRNRLERRDRPLASLGAAAGRVAVRELSLVGRSIEARRLDQYWRLNAHLRSMRAISAEYTAPALWVANDWWTLPIAAEGAARSGGGYVYDSHEFATEEYTENPRWARLQKPIVDVVERRFIAGAKVVSSVSEGITTQLRERYALTAPTLTVRNTPRYQATKFRPTHEKIRVLYHGVICPGRGLEATIDSVAAWRPEFSMHIRGPAHEATYLEALKSRAASVGARVEFLPPVPLTGLVGAAAAFDVGIMSLPGHSLHNVHALPNKLFEYLMAGLAIAVTDLPEMAALVRETNAGVLIQNADHQAIAAAINGLSRETVDSLRRNALAASVDLCWENESKSLIALYEKCTDAGFR